MSLCNLCSSCDLSVSQLNMRQLNQRLNAEAEKKAAKEAAIIRLVEQKRAEEAKVSKMG